MAKILRDFEIKLDEMRILFYDLIRTEREDAYDQGFLDATKAAHRETETLSDHGAKRSCGSD